MGDDHRTRRLRYAGSGNEGQVYRVDPSGRTVFFDSEELEVHALAPAPGGGLYVGTSPNGKIYRVDARCRHVLRSRRSLCLESAVDRAGNVFAATGDKGIIYKITPDGKGTPFYATKATHAMTLAFDRDGQLLAVPSPRDRVFRLDVGETIRVARFELQRDSQLRVDARGNIYVVAVSGRAPAPAGPQPQPAAPPPAPSLAPNVSTEITVVAVGDAVVTSSPQGGGTGQGRGAAALQQGRCFDPPRWRLGPAVGIPHRHAV